MEKKNFITLVLGVVGGLLFGIGMCMCLLPQWNAFNEGVIMGGAGVITLLVMIFARRKMRGKPPLKLSGKVIGTALLILAGVLLLGVGMCMTMVWENMMIPGILVGITGIVLLLFLIPLCKGLK